MDSLSKQGKNCKLYKSNRFKFAYVLKKSDETCYRCTTSMCTAKIYVNPSDVIREGAAPHRHADTVSDLKFEILRANCVIAASQHPDRPPRVTLHDELAEVVDASGESLDAKALSRCKTAIYRARRRQRQQRLQSAK